MKLLLLSLLLLTSCATPKLTEAEKYQLRKQRDEAEKQRLNKNRN